MNVSVGLLEPGVLDLDLREAGPVVDDEVVGCVLTEGARDHEPVNGERGEDHDLGGVAL